MRHILIVEDEKDMQELYRDMFADQKGKYEIDVEGDAATALRRLNMKTYDLIILDILMEPMTGDTFFVHVRQNNKTMVLPILVISVFKPDQLEQLKKINHVHFLQKPITKEILMKTIGKIFAS